MSNEKRRPSKSYSETDSFMMDKFLKELQRRDLVAKLKEQIDQALDAKDKQLFLELTEHLLFLKRGL